MRKIKPLIFDRMNEVQLIECPRDAMQGWKHIISTQKKIEYLNVLLQVGFHTIDCGSFVSPKAIPQMADTKEVLAKIYMANTASKLLVIVANERGAKEAAAFDNITYIGFPFSVSPTFQQRNTNSTPEESLHRIDAIQQICQQYKKQLVVYLSMAFGNPYHDAYEQSILLKWADEMAVRGIKIISLADTVGLATPAQIEDALQWLIPSYTDVQFGVHLHSSSHNWRPKLKAALDAGCRRFDGALKGIGGCPMAGDELVGNMNTEWILQYLLENDMPASLNQTALNKSLLLVSEIFV